jgi:hypothetical protein
MLGEFSPQPATAAELAAIERRLGRPIPPSYRTFLEEVGRVAWPLEIFAATPMSDAGLPEYLCPFAHDGSGNYHCFDLRTATPVKKGSRQGQELGISFWDHEDPSDEGAPTTPTVFSKWLEEMVDDAINQQDEEKQKKRRARIEKTLGPYARGAFTPSMEEALREGGRLGIKLPEDYLWFTTTLGSIRLPVRVVDAMDLRPLTEALLRDHPVLPKRLVAFAEETPGRYVTFDEKGKLVRVARGSDGQTSVQRAKERSFYDFLEHVMSLSKTKSAGAERGGTGLRTEASKKLLSYLIEKKAIDVDSSFDIDVAASALAGARLTPARLVDWLMDRDDVEEVFVSDEELAELLKNF